MTRIGAAWRELAAVLALLVLTTAGLRFGWPFLYVPRIFTGQAEEASLVALCLPLLLFLVLLRAVRRANPLRARSALALGIALSLAYATASPDQLFSVPKRIYRGIAAQHYRLSWKVDSAHELFAEFPELRINAGPHVQTRPPGTAFFLWTTNRVAGGVASLAGEHPDEPESSSLLRFRLEGWFAGLGLIFASWLWLLPLRRLARDLFGPRCASIALALGVLTPAILLLGPNQDMLGPTFVASALALMERALRSGDRRAAFGSGAVLAVGGLFSFGFLVVLLAFAGFAVIRGHPDLRKTITNLVLSGAGFLAVLALVFALTGYNYVRELQACSDNHLLGVTDTRPYAPFLWYSFYQFLTWAGLVASALAVRGLFDLRRNSNALNALLLPAFGTLLLLDLSGLSRGETERLWMGFLPFITLAAGARLHDHERAGHSLNGFLWIAFAGGVALKLWAVVNGLRV